MAFHGLPRADCATWPRIVLELGLPLLFNELIITLALDMAGGGGTSGASGDGASSGGGGPFGGARDGAHLEPPTHTVILLRPRLDVRLHRAALAFFHSRPLQFLGETSMSFYMVHNLVIQVSAEHQVMPLDCHLVVSI